MSHSFLTVILPAENIIVTEPICITHNWIIIHPKYVSNPKWNCPVPVLWNLLCELYKILFMKSVTQSIITKDVTALF
jgi:hypothetical protein